jgi:hypothetical protein
VGGRLFYAINSSFEIHKTAAPECQSPGIAAAFQQTVLLLATPTTITGTCSG